MPIFGPQDMLLCVPTSIFKEASLYITKLSIPYMPLTICLCGSKQIPLSLCNYPDLKNCFSINANIMVSKIAPFPMLLFGTLKICVRGSKNTPPPLYIVYIYIYIYIYIYMPRLRFSKVPLSTCLYLHL